MRDAALLMAVLAVFSAIWAVLRRIDRFLHTYYKSSYSVKESESGPEQFERNA